MGAAILQWRHLPGKSVLDLMWRHVGIFFQFNDYSPFAVTFRIVTNTDDMWRHAIIMPLDGRSVVSVTQLRVETKFDVVRFLLSRLAKQAAGLCVVRYCYCNTSASQLTQSLWTLYFLDLSISIYLLKEV